MVVFNRFIGGWGLQFTSGDPLSSWCSFVDEANPSEVKVSSAAG